MDFDFDTTSPEQVAAHQEELQAMLDDRIRSRDVLTDEIRELTELLVRGAGKKPQRRRMAPAQDRAIAALETASAGLKGTAVGPTSLYKFMEARGMETPKNPAALGTNLWDAWRAGRIMRASNGVYTPLDGTGRTEHDQPLTDYYFAAEHGFPVPE